jgi:hypothetical protein
MATPPPPAPGAPQEQLVVKTETCLATWGAWVEGEKARYQRVLDAAV